MRKIMKTLLIAAMAAVCVVFTGCASGPAAPTPAQALAQAQATFDVLCPVLNDGVVTLNALPLSAAIAKDLADVSPLISSTCTAVPTVTASTPGQFVNTVFPAITSIVNSAPNITVEKKSQITTAIDIAKAGLTLILSYLPATTAPAAPAVASGALAS
jgi:hypothetical protein